MQSEILSRRGYVEVTNDDNVPNTSSGQRPSQICTIETSDEHDERADTDAINVLPSSIPSQPSRHAHVTLLVNWLRIAMNVPTDTSDSEHTNTIGVVKDVPSYTSKILKY